MYVTVGFSLSDLQNAHHGPNVSPYPPPNGRFLDSLYLCGRNNQLEFIEFCWEGCHETGGSGANDFCESKSLPLEVSMCTDDGAVGY